MLKKMLDDSQYVFILGGNQLNGNEFTKILDPSLPSKIETRRVDANHRFVFGLICFGLGLLNGILLITRLNPSIDIVFGICGGLFFAIGYLMLFNYFVETDAIEKLEQINNLKLDENVEVIDNSDPYWAKITHLTTPGFSWIHIRSEINRNTDKGKDLESKLRLELYETRQLRRHYMSKDSSQSQREELDGMFDYRLEKLVDSLSQVYGDYIRFNNMDTTISQL